MTTFWLENPGRDEVNSDTSEELPDPLPAVQFFRIASSRDAALDVVRMKRAAAVGIFAPVGDHSFQATGITAYLDNGGVLEHPEEMAAQESPRTTKLYRRTRERLTQDEVERIRF